MDDLTKSGAQLTRERLAFAEANGLVDIARLVSELGASRQALHSWRKTGRIKKENYEALVRLSKRPMEWWVGKLPLDWKPSLDSEGSNVERVTGFTPVERIHSAMMELLFDDADRNVVLALAKKYEDLNRRFEERYGHAASAQKTKHIPPAPHGGQPPKKKVGT